MLSLAKQLGDMSIEIDQTSPEFANGVADGIESVPIGIARLYKIVGELAGLYGEDRAQFVDIRLKKFDLGSNQVFAAILDSKTPTTTAINFVHKHHRFILKALENAPTGRRAYILGRFIGRKGVLSKANAPVELGAKFGDLYHGITNSNIGPARAFEVMMFGDTY